ncbi:3',5'-cyclic-nucleotide phosphodiesterase [Candidatus Tenderia electrophaga]|uniref:3',5'-cyclic-nucleotide phosphodiesterase n=1 Tax=Candidatus Tenderia electrophaga TaxID=1748243 RepID=A0A0S2TBV0_9GAMM|nr:3',5'-cyclic-nucleotide phosphodiesterase [Candidatus Tenderia electrophaga]
MKLRILGCDGGIGRGLRTTSMLVDDDVLIDAGSGVGDLTLDEMANIRHIFLTHSHLDHVAFLPLLVDSIFERIEQPIVIHGLPATIQALREHVFNWAIWPDFAKLPVVNKPVMKYQEHPAGDICEVGGRRFESIPMNHIVPTVGYRVESAAGMSFAFTGDTTTNDTFWEAVNAYPRLDLLLLEVAFSNEYEDLSNSARHYCSKTVAADLAKLKLDPQIYLTHHKPEENSRILEELEQLVPDRVIKQLKNNKSFSL